MHGLSPGFAAPVELDRLPGSQGGWQTTGPGRLKALVHFPRHPNLTQFWCLHPQILGYFDIGFTSVFTVEIVLKVSPSAPVVLAMHVSQVWAVFWLWARAPGAGREQLPAEPNVPQFWAPQGMCPALGARSPLAARSGSCAVTPGQIGRGTSISVLACL